MRFAVLTSIVFTALVAATGGNNCDGGDTYCCNSSPSLTKGVSLADLKAKFQCTPLTVIGVPVGTTCSKSTVCCQDVGTNGLINIQCIAVTL